MILINEESYKVLKLILLTLLVTGIIIVITISLFTVNIWFPGITPSQTANILVNDSKFGMRALERAKTFGDDILIPLRVASDNFSKLNDRNSLWIAEVLASNQSATTLRLLRELYSSKNDYARLIASIGLAAQKQYPEEINENSFIVKAARRELPGEQQQMLEEQKVLGYGIYQEPFSELAIIALGNTGDKKAVPYLIEVLANSPESYWYHAYACNSLGKLGYLDAIPVLEDKMMDPNFYALPAAFEALEMLGECNKAIYLAMKRISKDGAGSHEFLIEKLKRANVRCTGKRRVH